MHPLLLSLFAASVIFFFFAVTMYQKAKKQTDELFQTSFQRDFIWSKNAMRFLSAKDQDRIIDNFEARWIGKVDKSYLLYHIGKLIEEQCIYLHKQHL
jgi:hypothetical protein